MSDDKQKGAPVMVHVVGMDGLIAQVNKCWLETMGYEEEDVLGRSPVEFLAPDFKKEQEELKLEKILKDGVARDRKISLMKKTGEVIEVTLNNFPQIDHDQEFSCSFTALSEDPDAGIMAYDMLVGKGVWSPKACALLGIKEAMEEVYFANHCSLLHEEDLYAFEDIFINPLDPHIPLLQNYRMRKGEEESGEYIPVSWWAQNVVYKMIIEKKEEPQEEESETSEESAEEDKSVENGEEEKGGEAEEFEEFVEPGSGGENDEPEEKITRLLISSIIKNPEGKN